MPPTAEEKKPKSAARHSLLIDRRQSVVVSGMLDVISFDEETVIGETEMGVIIIRGGNLHVNKINLDNGELAVDGQITGINYEDNAGGGKGKSLLGRLFK
ncbi:MAG: sporulation protein YabP [Clostridiales bacterium]|nr:sporulation protein YabP [Clostridiales bacterium]